MKIRKFLLAVLSAATVFGTLAVPVSAESKEFTVRSFAELKDTVTNKVTKIQDSTEEDPVVINVEGEIEVEESLAIRMSTSYDFYVKFTGGGTLKKADGYGYTYMLGFQQNITTHPVVATFENITLDGNGQGGYFLEVRNSKCVLKDGAVLKNNGEVAVYVLSTNSNLPSCLDMQGGMITGNVSDTGTDGGAITLTSNYSSSNVVTFKMSGGEITGNTARQGGAICDNRNKSSQEDMYTEITGGSIHDNVATEGKGNNIFVQSKNKFIVGGDANIPDGIFFNFTNDDPVILVESELKNTIGIESLKNEKDGAPVAAGYNGYELTEDDLTKFSINGKNLKLDDESGGAVVDERVTITYSIEGLELLPDSETKTLKDWEHHFAYLKAKDGYFLPDLSKIVVKCNGEILTPGGTRYEASLIKKDGVDVIKIDMYGLMFTGNVEISLAADKLADSVQLYFAPVDEEGRVYDLYLCGEDGSVINRLNTVDLTFALSPAASEDATGIDYEILPADGISIVTVDDDPDRFAFHFDTKDGDVVDGADTGAEIKIGTVKFTGYGTLNFRVADTARDTNAVHATEFANNIVSDFYPDGSANATGTSGALAYNGEDLEYDGDNEALVGKTLVGKIENQTLKPEETDVVINVYFPNAVENQSAVYEQMNVKIEGAPLKSAITVDLGSENANVSGVISDYEYGAIGDYVGYTFKVTLPAGYKYNLTVSGEGYRTYRESFVAEASSEGVVNIWNNVADEGGAKFLAGDIIAGNKINIYDLSAVVSYFGEEGLNEDSAKYKFAKYDLNRDGKIDSKDVAYVLVSWGN